uniref:Uncharacterized protein n=1 Tax=Caenorhabditis japonica TaxID=281687 RepID=A0A8R1IRG0_CAEJA
MACIGGICLATRFVYIYFIAKSNRRRRPTLDSPLSTTTNNNTISTTTTSTPTKSRASPVYKVCIIDAETSGRDVEMCAHHHSPPPAYTSPARLYKSVPTHDFETFRDDSNV